MNEPPEQRSRTPEPPYCWQSKAARRIIYEYFDGDVFGASCLGVYTALTEIASDKEAEIFTTPQSYIAQKSCLGITTIRKALKELRSLGLLAYQTPRLRGPITFTLLTTRRTLVATRRTLLKVQNRRPLSTVEEHNEELLEEHNEDSSPEESSASAGEGSVSEPATHKKTAACVSIAGLSFANWFRSTLPAKVSLVAGWRQKWARAYDDLLRLDKRDQAEIERVCQWARSDEFWAPQFQSPLKLRKRNRDGVTYYDLFVAKMNGAPPPRRRRKEPPI
jgi:hypothetical protein